MRRRDLFKRFAAVGAALAIAPMVAEAALADDEGTRIAALARDVMANPGKHPALEASARRLTGDFGNETSALYERGPATWGEVSSTRCREDILLEAKARLLAMPPCNYQDVMMTIEPGAEESGAWIRGIDVDVTSRQGRRWGTVGVYVGGTGIPGEDVTFQPSPSVADIPPGEYRELLRIQDGVTVKGPFTVRHEGNVLLDVPEGASLTGPLVIPNPRRDGSLTFEAMQADCAARGCVLLIATDVQQANGAAAHHFAHGRGNHIDALQHMSLLAGQPDPWTLSEADVWRRGLHG